MSTQIPTPEPVRLPQELQEFLLELALAVQRHAIYPGGHPSVDAALAALAARASRLLEQREVVSLGVARRQVIVEGVASDPGHAVLRSFAERLHRHRLGAVAFRRGVVLDELRGVLGAVARDPDRGDGPLGSLPPDRLRQWPHVGLYPVLYEQLRFVAHDGPGPEGEPVVGAGPAAQLWHGLARAAAALGDAAAAPAAAAAADPQADAVAQSLNGSPGTAASDRLVMDYLLQLAAELKQGGDDAPAVRHRVSELIRQLEPAALRRLLSLAGDAGQRARFLHDAADALTPDAVLELVKAAGAAQGQDISTGMLRLLTKLSALAADEVGPVSERAETAVREQVRGLLAGWSLEDPNPDAYTRALDDMARAAGTAEDDDGAAAHAAEPLRIVQMGLEVGAAGVTFWRAVDSLIATAGLPDLVALLDAADTADPLAGAVWRRLESADHVRRVLTTDPVDFNSLDRILERLPAATVISLLLDRLSESASRTTRMGLFQRLRARGYAAVPPVMERLHDNRWFVLRNMLALLNEIGAWPADFSPLDWARHPQASVRREALQLAARLEAQREQAIVLALGDVDERAVRVGVRAAREHGLPAAAAGTLLRRLEEPGMSPELRAALIRLLGQHAAPPVIDLLLRCVVQERRLLGPRLLPPSPELVAALSVLARLHSTDARVATALELAATSPDPAVRAAARSRP